jgi:NAD-dependent aldehyde dehydrogenases
VAFTGSTEVGKQIARACAPTRKKVTLELGGKAANVVFEDAPVDQAVEGIVNGIFFNQGHVCCAGSRLLVQESVYSEVLRRCGGGWPPCGSATRWTRTPTSAPSTPPPSWPRSASCPRSARRRARSAGRRRASCR